MSKRALEIRDKTIFDGFFVKHILKFVFAVWFKITGWKPTKSAPQGAGITIAAPHTSNWDVVYALAAAIMLDIKIYFSIKESWCRVPVVGRIIMWLGAIPIDRTTGAQGQVQKIKRFVDKHKNSRIFFLFTPEGTRGKINKWKSGFYHMAKNCHLPIFLAKVDYRTKESGVFHSYTLTGDKEQDILSIQESYKNVKAKFPAIQFPRYTGPVIEFSDAEAMVLKTIYSVKGVATKMEIAARLKMKEFSENMLDYLVERGVLEQYNDSGEPTYQLTFAGKGYLLHHFPALS